MVHLPPFFLSISYPLHCSLHKCIVKVVVKREALGMEDNGISRDTSFWGVKLFTVSQWNGASSSASKQLSFPRATRTIRARINKKWRNVSSRAAWWWIRQGFTAVSSSLDSRSSMCNKILKCALMMFGVSIDLHWDNPCYLPSCRGSFLCSRGKEPSLISKI